MSKLTPDPDIPGPNVDERPPDPSAGKDALSAGHEHSLPRISGITLHFELARGGMGVVYSGRQDFLDRRVAVKLLSAAIGGESFVQRFQREAKILAGIKHPNIVACYMAGQTDEGQSYLVMEFIDGPSLKKWITDNGPVPVTAALRTARAVGQALGHAHTLGVIHRDVKPENILLETVASTALDVTFPFTPKVVDLGLARASEGNESMGLTSPGAVMGTPYTMSPEQYDEPDQVDFRTDIYGLGCALYEMLTAKPAFRGKKLSEIVARKRDPLAPDPCTENPDVPSAVGALVQSMLAPERENRPASYKELNEMLAALIDGLPSSRIATSQAFGGDGTRTGAFPPAGDNPTLVLGGGKKPVPKAQLDAELDGCRTMPVKPKPKPQENKTEKEPHERSGPGMLRTGELNFLAEGLSAPMGGQGGASLFHSHPPEGGGLKPVPDFSPRQELAPSTPLSFWTKALYAIALLGVVLLVLVVWSGMVCDPARNDSRVGNDNEQRPLRDVRSLAFEGPITAANGELVDGVYFTPAQSLQLAGKLCEPGVTVRWTDQSVATTDAEGAFTCLLPVPEWDKEVSLTLVGTKPGFQEAAVSLRAVALSKPAFRTTVPAATRELSLELRVATGIWTKTVVATVRNKPTPLARENDNGSDFVSRITLARGENTIDVVATNVLGASAQQALRVVSLEQPTITKLMLEVDGTNQELKNGAKRWLKSSGGKLRALTSGTAPEVYADGHLLTDGTLVLELSEGVMRTYSFLTKDELRASMPLVVSLGLDTEPPHLVPTAPREPVPSDQAGVVSGTWNDSSGLAELTLLGRPIRFTTSQQDPTTGTWTFLLQGPAHMELKALDFAGNMRTVDLPIKVVAAAPTTDAPTNRVRFKGFDGFSQDDHNANDLGYPKVITDNDTGIELVGVPFEQGAKPRLYVGKQVITARQFDGSASDNAKLGVTGKEVNQWLIAHKRRFDLLLLDEWLAVKDSPALSDAKSNTVEWLKPARWTADYYPICKGGRTEYRTSDSLPTFGFRVVFRVP